MQILAPLLQWLAHGHIEVPFGGFSRLSERGSKVCSRRSQELKKKEGCSSHLSGDVPSQNVVGCHFGRAQHPPKRGQSPTSL
jgi:hypothetical protein